MMAGIIDETDRALYQIFLIFAIGFVILTLPVDVLFTRHVPSAGGEADEWADGPALRRARGPRRARALPVHHGSGTPWP